MKISPVFVALSLLLPALTASVVVERNDPTTECFRKRTGGTVFAGAPQPLRPSTPSDPNPPNPHLPPPPPPPPPSQPPILFPPPVKPPPDLTQTNRSPFRPCPCPRPTAAAAAGHTHPARNAPGAGST
ncbi:hypothetical protein B0H13DRAFT_2374543 [Mycena leptocephala]|nr:hypothetical protein B0H13DRAFT_2374543 [Mycena leptocephala]